MSVLWYVNTKEKVSKCTSARVKQLYLTQCYLMYYFALTSDHTTWKQRTKVSMQQFTREERLFIVETYIQVENVEDVITQFQQRFPGRRPPGKAAIFKTL